jgi:hypothetical protein
MTLIKKGSEVFMSKKGYNDFFYPDPFVVKTLLEDTIVQQMSWVGSMDLFPVLIPESAIFASGDSKKMIPVWVKKGMLKSVKAS